MKTIIQSINNSTMSKQYNRIMLGKGGIYADECKQQGYIGADFGIHEDLSANLTKDRKAFNEYYSPIFLKAHPNKTKVGAGLSCGYLYTICKGLQKGDIILSPKGNGEYYVGEIEGGYYYKPNTELCHRRRVKWYDKIIARNSMTESLQNSTGSIGTCCDISQYYAEIEGLIKAKSSAQIISSDPDITNPSEFAMEKYLEEFIVDNWNKLPISKEFDIYEEDGEQIGRQYDTGVVGKIDILAQSKNKKILLVIELKRGQTSDKVIGQVQRYMGFLQEEMCTPDQTVKGLIIAHDDDKNLQYALKVCQNIDFARYEINFKLTGY